MNSAKAASRMRSRTAVSSLPSCLFEIDVLFIPFFDGSGTEWYHLFNGTRWYQIAKENREDTTMKFMIALFMAVFPALSFAQSQTEAGQGLPAGAIPKTTAVFVIQTPRQGVTVQQVIALIPDEIQATARLYLDGKIREWYSRGDGKGV